jgi:hypothetical protein
MSPSQRTGYASRRGHALGIVARKVGSAATTAPSAISLTAQAPRSMLPEGDVA